MRPSRRQLVIGLVVLALSALIIATERMPVGVAIALWIAFAVTILFDLLISLPGRSVSATLETPREVFSGEDAAIDIKLNSRSRALPENIEGKIDIEAEFLEPTIFQIRGGQANIQSQTTLPAKRRGKFDITALWLKWPSRLGFWEVVSRKPMSAVLNVVPNIRPVSSGQIDVTVRSELYGVKENILHGEGSEFHQLREFMPGMDVRSIDWKRSARHRGLVAKEMRAERNHQVILALDNGYLMREEIAGLPKIDHAVNAALATAWAAGLGGDLVGMYSFDARPRTFLPPQPGRMAFAQLRSQTANMSYESVETNHTLAMANLNSILNRRSLIVVFSDFVDTTTAELLLENIIGLNRKHVLVFVTISDPALSATSSSGLHSLQAMAESVSAAQMLRERRLVLDKLRRVGVICLETAPNQLTAALVSTYLRIKSQELI